ncbi:MAG: EVE domain-containing protein [Deltaproteobacteria bacterium]|nr:EVE domain-containing protein [Deltaproteobacteria bacterium]
MSFWLLKSEPGSYSIGDLRKDKTTFWNGVRNFQARNFLRDSIKAGDGVLFYHSNADPSGVAGLAKVVKSGYPDPTALDPKSKYFDPRASRENPVWFMVDIVFVKKFKTLIDLDLLRHTPGLEKMMVLKRGSRLSVQPVLPKEFDIVKKLGEV